MSEGERARHLLAFLLSRGMYRVRLINLVASHGQQLFPVCGISHKNYGQAMLRPEFKGFVFELPLEDYERDKFDIIGNTKFQQQWIPEFLAPEPVVVQAVAPANKPKKEKTLIDRAKAAGVYKKGMTEEEIKLALGFPD